MLKKFGLFTVVTTIGAILVDHAFTGVDAARHAKPFTQPEAEGLSTLEQLREYPGSTENAIVLQAILGHASSEKELAKINGTAPATYEVSPYSPGYVEDQTTYPRRALYDLTVKMPDGTLQFEAIANHHDAKTGFTAFAMVEKSSGQLILFFPGMDDGLVDVKDGIRQAQGRASAQLAWVPGFLDDVYAQIHARGLDIEATMISAHSLGTSSAFLASALLRGRPQGAFGEIGAVVAIEGWMERPAFNHAIREAVQQGVTTNHAELAAHVCDLRRIPVTFIGNGDQGNMLVGAQRLAIVPAEARGWVNPFTRAIGGHTLRSIVQDFQNDRVMLAEHGATQSTHTTSLLSRLLNLAHRAETAISH